MTISSTTRKAGPFAGNSVATTFPFTFKVFSNTDIKVLLAPTGGTSTTLTLDSDYSVSLNANQDTNPGGTITYPINGTPLAIGYVLVVLGALPYLQPTDLTNSGGFYPRVIEDMSDRATIEIQQLAEVTSRAIVVAESDSTSPVLPAAAGRAGMLLGFDSQGGVELYAPTASVGAGDLKDEEFNDGTDYASGASTSITLSRLYGTKANLGAVVMQGIVQPPSTYSLNGYVLTFNAVIPVGVSKIWLKGGTTLSNFAPADGSVGDPKIAWSSILSREVASVTELRALSSGLYNRASSAGYYTPGDGGQAKYYLDPADSTSTDNGGSVIVATDGGRWKLVSANQINVRTFGAKGDGTTDDSAAFQSYATWLGAQGGGIYTIPRGNFVLNTCVNFPPVTGADSHITVAGTKDGSQLSPGAGMSSLFYVTGKNFEISGVFFVNASNYATSGIEFSTSSLDAGYSALVERNKFIGFVNGIKAAGQNYNINKNFFQNNTNHLLFANDGRNTGIEGNYMLGGAIGIHLARVSVQAEGTRILNNTILATVGGGAGVEIDAGLDITLANNIIDQTGPGSPGVYMASGTNTIAKVKMIGNWIAAGQNSYSIYASGNTSAIEILANSIVSNNGLAATAGISLNGTNGYDILANNFAIISGVDLSFASVVNGNQLGNTSDQGGSNAVANAFSQPTAVSGTVTGTAFQVVTGGPTIEQGVGVPTAVRTPASLFLRTDGGTGGRLYVTSGGGAWAAVAGV